MTGTLISLISICFGILGANSLGFILKKYSFGPIGNTIIGVFGSVFLIKSFGRLGFDPWSIMHNENFHFGLFITNCVVSFLGGLLGLLILKLIVLKINNSKG
ncbi:MAG: hypothetical protein ABJM36_01465 [Algibacter sp.]|uniref:hypothetical protein n=1 Tax=Algibacter sp. TaxID=1872428 RepID=UPI00329881E3